MEIEYSNQIRGKVYAFRFDNDEMKAIAAGLGPQIKKVRRKIERIQNHPKNEGQATYAEQIRHLDRHVSDLLEIVRVFTEESKT